MSNPIESADLNLGSDRDKKHESVAEDEQHDQAEEKSDEDDFFFDSLNRVPSGISFDLDHVSTESDSDEDVRISFASALEAPRFSVRVAELDDYVIDEDDGDGGFDYGMWMAEHVPLNERRRRLRQGMGLESRKNLVASTSRQNPNTSHLFPHPLSPSSASVKSVPSAEASRPWLAKPAFIARSLSDSHMSFEAPAAPGLVRCFSSPPSPWICGNVVKKCGSFGEKIGRQTEHGAEEADGGEAGVGACKIKNLDTGKEFVVSEVGKDGSCGQLNDVQTGLPLTMEEFERSLGFSPIVKELMRRVNLGEDNKRNGGGNNSFTRQGYSGKSPISRGRKRGSWLKNIKFVASSVTGLTSEKERYQDVSGDVASGRGFSVGKSASLNGSSSDWLKVHQHGKSYKELTGLYMCQEIQAHQGSIWCMRFSSDGRLLASAGEDRIIHVWQVKESETCSTFTSVRRKESHLSSASVASNMSSPSSKEQDAIIGSRMSKRTRSGSKRGSKKSSLPDYVVLPEIMFSISEMPFCSFEGHLDDVLDLSWSKSQHLLSSSMDKTVRLWDMKSRACLKLFAHNDYVTCIQFNPKNDDYFISGSLDGKVRIWSIPKHQVVDWSGLHEMVTAVCYTPDGQGALVGSHKGSVRFYNTSDVKLFQENQIDISHKKKLRAKKITGFQYAPDNLSQVMVTSAGSQIRVFDGVNIIRKFRGFRNTSSQISASFSSDGKYVVCASEDSHVYIWKCDSARNVGRGGKSRGRVTTRSNEYFYCKDVSVAIPWPNIGSNCKKPTLPSPSSRNLGASNRSSQSNLSLHDSFPKDSLEQILTRSPATVQISSSHAATGLSRISSLRLLRSSLNSSSSSSFASRGWGGGSNKVVESSLDGSNGWGLVVVTAGLGGNIRIYQNFGLPVRLSRQNLF